MSAAVGTIEDLHASAERITGLADFGADDYRDGLAVLLESYDADAALTPLGARAVRADIRGALIARLLSEAAWQRNPEYVDTDVSGPHDIYAYRRDVNGGRGGRRDSK